LAAVWMSLNLNKSEHLAETSCDITSPELRVFTLHGFGWRTIKIVQFIDCDHGSRPLSRLAVITFVHILG
jgi:hypothetical protein